MKKTHTLGLSSLKNVNPQAYHGPRFRVIHLGMTMSRGEQKKQKNRLN
jgi:hypothetical protein